MNRNKRGHLIGALFLRNWLILISQCIILFLFPLQVLTLEGEDKVDGIYIGASEVSLRWQHSVEKEEWEEFFVIGNSDIFLKQTRFKTFGAGVPSDAGKDTFIKDGWVYMTGINRSIGNHFYFRTGKTTEHRITIDGQSDKLKANSSYHMTVKQLNLIQALLYKIRVL
ncbi:DUF1850 domain-containing protein [Pseudalkalibacillus hwajinpoensis]|uniref:DUF1850 domain-containing protein n=1 Tax=Guptibacillus hwajinpoensis TaxID=208199 RepID=UPI00196BA8CE|nr:DUF1850 domain-containing protein [Pseudalkalibacillus hwajinpoensis]